MPSPSLTLDLARQLTVVDNQRFALLLVEARRQAHYGGGDFIELGVFRGGTALAIAHAIVEQGHSALHLLDSWEGMPPPTPEDGKPLVGKGFFSQASEESVREAFAKVGLSSLIRTHKGWIEQTLPHIPGPFALVHLDCDYYAPALFALRYLLPRMTPLGVIVLDDYGQPEAQSFPGMRRAVAEAIAGTEWRVMPLGGERDPSAILLRKPREEALYEMQLL